MPFVDFLVLRPFTGWPLNEDLELANGVWVKRLQNEDAPSFKEWSEALSSREIRSLTDNRWWFAHSFQDEPVRPSPKQQSAEEKVLHATLAFIILTPGGNDGTLILCQKWENRWLSQTIHHFPQFHSTRWGRMVALDPTPLGDIVSLVQGVTESANRGIIRLINPFHFLENGLQSTNIHLRILLWTTGLDALLMATTPKRFVERLCNFLGGDTFVFPPLELFGQPKYRIKDVASDLYDLRSCIAHGKEIPRKYRRPCGFVDVAERSIEGYPNDYQYRQVLVECALFLLCRALRKVFVSNLVQTVGKQKEWRRMLDTTQAIL